MKELTIPLFLILSACASTHNDDKSQDGAVDSGSDVEDSGETEDPDTDDTDDTDANWLTISLGF